MSEEGRMQVCQSCGEKRYTFVVREDGELQRWCMQCINEDEVLPLPRFED